MSAKIGKSIVWGNIAIVAIIYICAASISRFDGIGSAFFFTLLQVILNLVIAIVLSIIHLATKRSHSTLGEATRGFWLSIGLVILISFPTCLLVGQIRPFHIHGAR